MGTSTATRGHPARFTPAILDVLAPLIAEQSAVWDPFAGTGERLGALCDRYGVPFGGTDLETWPGQDPRVRQGDACDPGSYPLGEFLIVTSPSYGNGLNDHFAPRDTSRRYTYRTALGRELHENNTGRYGIRGGKQAWARYWELHGQAVACWADRQARALVNVKAFVHAGQVVDLPGRWVELLETAGLTVTNRIEVRTPGIRHGANRDRRVECETVLVVEPRVAS